MIKTASSKSTINTQKSSEHLMYRRLSTIEEYFGIKNFTANKIQKSGMLKMAHDKINCEEISKEVYIEIVDRFNIKTSLTHIKETVNLDNIRKLY